MPSKKRKYNARFPAGRIKKIMRIDDEIGKVALPVPVMISRALELFVSSLLIKAGDVTMQKSARTLTLAHLKQCIYSDSRLDFLKELVKSAPDHSEECNDTTDPPVALNNPASNNDSDEETSSETVECRLLNGCACRLSADEYAQLVAVPIEAVASPSDIIAHLSAMRLMLSSRRCRQQQPDSGRCPTVERACSETLSGKLWIDRLLAVLASPNNHVRYVATCVATEVVLSGAVDDSDSLDYLIDGLLLTITKTIGLPQSRASAAAVNVLTRVLNAKDDGWRISTVKPSCCGGDPTVHFSAIMNGRDTKMLLLDRLHCHWSEVVNASVRKNGTMAPTDHDNNDLPELVGLWAAVFRALRSMGSECRNIEKFYLELLSLEWLLYRMDTEPLVWLNMIRLFGGSLQRCVDKPIDDRWMAGRVAVAGRTLTSFTRKRLLYFVGKMANAFGRENDRSKIVLQETVLLAMRSLREFAASHSQSFSSDDDKKVALVATIRDVVNCLDSYVKSSMLYTTDVQFCQWMVRLMCDRDDTTIECLSCALDVVDVVPVIQPLLDPFAGFAELLACVSYEPDVLLDYLISDDSEFLPYALRVLKMVCRDAWGFFRSCGSGLDDAMGLLIKLRLKMLRLHKNCVFPFNVVPFTKLIQRCDELYTDFGL